MACQQRLARTRGTDEQEIMASGRGDLQGASSQPSPADVGEVGRVVLRLGLKRRLRFRPTRADVRLTALPLARWVTN